MPTFTVTVPKVVTTTTTAKKNASFDIRYVVLNGDHEVVGAFKYEKLAREFLKSRNASGPTKPYTLQRV